MLRTDLHKNVKYRRPTFYAVRNALNFLNDTITCAGVLNHNASTSRDLSVLGIKGADGKTIGAVVWFKDRMIISFETGWIS